MRQSPWRHWLALLGRVEVACGSSSPSKSCSPDNHKQIKCHHQAYNNSWGSIAAAVGHRQLTLVQVSPMIMMVAVAVPSAPPQHSPLLVHLASSHTVLSFSSLHFPFLLSSFSPFSFCCLP